MSSSISVLQSSNRFGVAHTTWSTAIAATPPGHSNTNGVWALSNGNLTATVTSNPGTSTTCTSAGSIGVGKWYWEVTIAAGTSVDIGCGITKSGNSTANGPYVAATDYCYGTNGNKYNNNAGVAYGSTLTIGDVLGIAFDNVNGILWFSKNGVWQNSGTISEVQNGTTTHAAFSGITTGATYYASTGPLGSSAQMVATANFGGTNFAQTCPTGFTGLY